MTDNPYATYQLPVAHMLEAADWLEALSDGDVDEFINYLLDHDTTAFERMFPSWYVEVAWADITTRADAWRAATDWNVVWSSSDTVAWDIARTYGRAWDGTDRGLAELVMKTHVTDHLDRKGAWRVLVRRNDDDVVTVWGQTPAEWVARQPLPARLNQAIDALSAEVTAAHRDAGRLLDLLNSR